MEDVEKVPTIGVSFNIDLPRRAGLGARALVLQTFVDRDTSIEHLNEVLDKIRCAAERQEAHNLLLVAKQQLEVEERVGADHVNRIAVVEENHNRRWLASNRKGPMRLSDNEEKERLQAHNNAEESKRRIALMKKEIADLVSLAGA